MHAKLVWYVKLVLLGLLSFVIARENEAANIKYFLDPPC
jgi:hypothetical protein